MAQIRPFAAIHYPKRKDLDFSKVIAPPYDVLDERDKAELQARHPNNVVTIDLPHLPPKTAGPDETYGKANQTLQAWLSAGILQHDSRAALYPYTQSYDHAGRTFHRRGFIALVRLSPFGAGQIVPHEKTYKGPIEDRLKLMHATGVQLSPIFGLFSDPGNKVTSALYHNLSLPMLSGTLAGVKNDLWSVNDAHTINTVIDLMADKPVYIADGHHRYTTALQYQQDMEKKNGGPLPPNHPANFCMFVLIGMQDPGLLILPTHRLIGGLAQFDIPSLQQTLGDNAQLQESPFLPEHMEKFAASIASQPPHTFGLFDGRSRKLYTLHLKNPAILQSFEPKQSSAWRSLDVAILQRYLVDEILQPRFSPEKPITLGYTADPNAITPQVDGSKYQLALLLQPTPLHALEDLGRHGEVMPQKSTYFFPKLATGMVLNPLT